MLGGVYPFPQFSCQPHLSLLLFNCISTGLKEAIPHYYLPCLGAAISYLLSVLILEWSVLKIYFRINTFLLKLSQEMSTTILTHLHFTYILKCQPYTGILFGQSL